jgi:hypothetical protein
MLVEVKTAGRERWAVRNATARRGGINEMILFSSILVTLIWFCCFDYFFNKILIF